MTGQDFDIQLLYSERQAAQSFINAFPDKRFACQTARAFTDAESTPNANFVFQKANANLSIPLYSESVCPLDEAFARAGKLDFILPVSKVAPSGEWIAKGRYGHRPDALLKMRPAAPDSLNVELYQAFEKSDATFTVTGRFQKRSYQVGAFRILREAFGWQDWIVAAETAKAEILVDRSLQLIESIGFEGFFTVNWIRVKGQWLATSFRPYPRALIGCLKRAGANVLDERADCAVAREGIRVAFEINYHPIEWTR